MEMRQTQTRGRGKKRVREVKSQRKKHQGRSFKFDTGPQEKNRSTGKSGKKEKPVDQRKNFHEKSGTGLMDFFSVGGVFHCERLASFGAGKREQRK